MSDTKKIELGTTNCQLEVLTNGVAVLTIDLPYEKMNLLSGAVMKDIDLAVEHLGSASGIQGLVITSGKKDSFVAGANIGEIQAIQHKHPIAAYEASELGKALFAKIESLPFRTVVAINGICLGGGTELSLACNYRIATEATKIGVPEVNLGFIPGWGGTVRLPLLVGLQTGLDLILTGRTLSGRKAWKAGLVDEVVDASSLLDRAIAVALGGKVKRFKPGFKAGCMKALLEGNRLGRYIVRKMATKTVIAKTRGKYPAPFEAIKVVFKAVTGPRDKAFAAESDAFARLAVTDVSRNIVGIFFAQQEAKKSPEGVKPAIDVKTVGVLGAGIMGAGIAQAAAYAGYKVVLFDIAEAALTSARTDRIGSLFAGLVKKRKLTSEEADALMANITYTTSYEPLAACEMVIEAIVERMNIKQAAIREIEAVRKEPYIFASNTSSLKIAGMAEASRDPSLVAGLHFFNPVHKLPAVEAIRHNFGPGTSEETLAAVRKFATRIGKTVITTADSPGFVVNRILAPYLVEAIKLVEAGVPFGDIDKAMTRFGFPMGPIQLLDHVGLDIIAHVTRALEEQIGTRLAAPEIARKIEELKLLGVKGGKGFYLYEGDKPAGPNPEVTALVKAPATRKTTEEIQSRLVLALLNEAVRCLEENVVTEPAQLDLSMIMCTGFPPFEGGILRYGDKLGCRTVLQNLQMLEKVEGSNYEPAALLATMAAYGRSFYKQ